MTDATPDSRELAIVAWLDSPEGRAVVAGLRDYDAADALATTHRLRRAGVAPEHAAAAMTQVRLREAARGRLGDVVDELLLTDDGSQQATRTVVADLHAARLAAAGVTEVADLGCGIGADSLAFLRAGLAVLAVERDPVTAAVAAANLRRAAPPGSHPGARVLVGDALEAAAGLQPDMAMYADPARRRDGRRILDPAQWSPPLGPVLDLAGDPAAARALGVKVAPGIDHAALPAQAEAEFVSVDGVLVEAAIWLGVPRTAPGRVATVIRTRGAASGPAGTTNHSPDNPNTDHPRIDHLREDSDRHPEAAAANAPVRMAEVRPLGEFLYEPGDAVLRAGLVARAGELLDPDAAAGVVSPGIAYLTGDAPLAADSPAAPFLTGYRVLDVLPLTVKTLRAHLRALDVTEVTVKKRGVSVEPERLRRDLALGKRRGRAGGRAAARRPATLVVTPVAGATRVLLVEPTPR